MTMILSDGTQISLADASFNKHYVISCQDCEDFKTQRDKLTEQNLAEIQITDSGQTIATVRNAMLTGVQEVINSDGSVTGHFYFSGGETVQPESEYSEAGRILMGEE